MPGSVVIALIPLLPLAGFALLGLFGKKIFKSSSGIIGTLLLLAATILSLYIAYGYFFEYGKTNGSYQKLIPFHLLWLPFSGNLSIDMAVILDPISVMMIVVVTFVSLMVHVYSLAYMKGEERFATYFSFLSLFTFSMLGLVLSSNIFQIYIFWELVGVSSFLLIGYYYDRPSAVAASKKAFIVTRFADLGFLVGILILSFYSNTLDFSTLIQRLTSSGSDEWRAATAASFLGISALTWGATLVFIGGAGKSAMFPLHIWLPDAMEGPTPVSALIHAATMVVAGVYLVARLFPVFAITQAALHLVAYVGAISAFLAALIACTQTDVKRVLAFSTMSQIGYMMLSLGVSGYGTFDGLGYTASMFHLFTHAMFKALLFLCAGVIIHYAHSNDMTNMGGLRQKLPVTHISFLVACLAISGIPPLSGFFSKEDILFAASKHNIIIYWMALITSGITAFYMFRLYFNIFWNKENSHGEHSTAQDSVEGGALTTFPLIILVLGSIFSGLVPFGNFISFDGIPQEVKPDLTFSILPVALGLMGILMAGWLYKKQNDRPDKMASAFSRFYKTVYHKFYIDELYLFITKKILFNLVGKPAAWFDKRVVDGLVNLTGNTTTMISEKIKGFQSGKLQQYAMYFLIGAAGLALVFIYYWH